MKEAQVKIKTNAKDTDLALAIRDQLRSRVANIENVRLFERKNGLTPGTINNIINGTSSNPTAETLNTLANAFGCSIDDLLDRNTNQASNNNNLTALKNSVWKSDLYIEISKELAKEIEKGQIKINTDKALLIIQEVYSYLIKKNKTSVDESLIGWVLDKTL